MTPDEIQTRREKLYELLGDLPPRDRLPQARLLKTESREHFDLEHLELDLNGTERVPAYFLRPHGGAHGGTSNGAPRATGAPSARSAAVPEPPFPTVLYSHAHGRNYELGKTEILEGRDALADPPYGEALAREGFAAMCIDHWGFCERYTASESYIFKDMLWRGQVMWGMMVYDSLAALRYLRSRDDVDSSRVAALGMSMGSTMSWWVAALDPRVSVCVDICCMTEFESLRREGGLDGHGIYYYVPGLLKHFTTSDINRLIAPRPHLSLNGTLDPLTPPEGLDIVDAALTEEYRTRGAPQTWRMFRSESGHTETSEMREAALSFLREHL